ncbi:Gfo/Idh/MocA family protein [Haloferula chungangensis]|uniref:Gfo/Idh/MocA family protein n=1 Tax=Haloferula chungangensis TaxID=1048331 RepID=A0ABW2L6V5_9BACT
MLDWLLRKVSFSKLNFDNHFTMRIAVIGAGVWGKNLVKNLGELGALAAVADAVDSNRESVQEKYPDLPVYESGEELLGKEELDAVAIATPPHTHCAIALAAMKMGLDVFVEKPMTLDPAEAETMADYAKEKGRILMVGHLLLYQPAISFIKEYIDSGKLGRIRTLTQRRSKLGRVRSIENVLWSFGVHDVAVLLHLAGEEPTEVVSFGHSGISPNIEDDYHLHLSFPSGIKANLHNSWLWPRVERELIITGEKGILVFDEVHSQVILHKKTVTEDLAHHDQGNEVIFEGHDQPLRLELEHFIDCCCTRDEPISGSSNGVACVNVLSRATK